MVEDAVSIMKTFKHSGDMGDIIFSLPTIRALGGGVLFLDPEGGESEPLVSWSNFTHTKLTPVSIRFLSALLWGQKYIKEVRWWDGREVDYNLDKFRSHVRFNNLSDSHLAAFALPFEERNKKWLSVHPKKLDKPYIIARSARYHSNFSFWEQIDPEIVNNAYYLGLEKEHEYFEYTFGHKIDRHEAEDILDLAGVIAGWEKFFGNQGLPHAIAEGLKKDLVNEVYRVYPGAVFERENAEYV